MKTKYILQLFLNGQQASSAIVKKRTEEICQTYLKENYSLEVIDISENINAALEYNVILTPMLILESPKPQVTIIGNMEDAEKVRMALRL